MRDRNLCSALLGCALLSCAERPQTLAGPQAPAKPAAEVVARAPLRGWHYNVRLHAPLAVAEIEICFDGLPPARLVPGAPGAQRWVRRAYTTGGAALRPGRKGIDLAALPAGECVHMEIDLRTLAPEGDNGRTARRVGNSVLASPSAWLWRPAWRPSPAEVTLRFDLPEHYQVSVPWPTLPGTARGRDATYTLDETAFGWMSYAAWGALDIVQLEHGGVKLEVATLNETIACTHRGLERWLGDAIDTVAEVFGGSFPRDHLQVVLVPVAARGGTVHFGMAGRGGGPAIFILLDRGAHGHELQGTWTTVHEMLHHGMPFIADPWMAEGWVTYYTEVALTRADHLDEAAGWAKLARGFARGARGGRGLSLRATSKTMRETFAYQRVYWGGAAVALLTDVALREDSAGAVTLDDAMAELRRCCADAPKRWPAGALLSHLDAWYGRPLFTEVAERALNSTEFPATTEALARLGVTLDADGGVQLDDARAGARMRRSIMTPVPAP